MNIKNCDYTIDIIEKIKKQISTNPVILYMKGSPEFPSCGFSARTAKILSICYNDNSRNFINNNKNNNFAYIDVLINPDIRTELPKFSGWPTFPQLWINKKLIGGCDIVIEMYQKGDLQHLLQNVYTKLNKK